MPQGKWFRIGYGIIVVLLIAYLASLVDYLFDPIGAVLTALFVPILLSGVFYYMFRPLVRLIAIKLPLTLSIIIVYLLVLGLIYLSAKLVWPPIREQAIMLVNNFPDIVESIKQWLISVQKHQWVKNMSQDESFSTENLTNQLTAALGDLLNSIIGSVTGVFNMIMNFFLLLGLVPFIIYYMLKEGHKFPNLVTKLLPDRLRSEVLPALKDIDSSIGAFIMSKVITSLIIGGLTFCGYLIIDLPYPLLLGLVAAVTNVIPYLGPLLAAIPTIIVALTVSPVAVLQVCAIIVISNQIESNLIGPKITGKQLNVHPLTIMLLIIGVGAVIGPIGMVIVVPTYAILKIIAIRIYNFYNKNRIEKEPNFFPPKQ
jgi:predicted PurR-regulated permease PerM